MTILEQLESEVKQAHPKAVLTQRENGAYKVEEAGVQLSGWSSNPKQAWASAWSNLNDD